MIWCSFVELYNNDIIRSYSGECVTMITLSVLSELAVHELPFPFTQWLAWWLLGMAFLQTQMVVIRNSWL